MTSSKSIRASSGMAARRAEQQVLPHRRDAETGWLPETRSRVGALCVGRKLPSGVCQTSPSMSHKPSGKRRRPAMQRSTVVLPQPDGPNSAVTPLAGAVKPASRTKLPMVPRNSAWIVCAAVMRASPRSAFQAGSWTGSPRMRRPPCRPREYWPRAIAWSRHSRKWRST